MIIICVLMLSAPRAFPLFASNPPPFQQQAQEDTKDLSQEKQIPEAIPADAILIKSEETINKLNEQESKIAIGPEIQKIEKEWESFMGSIRKSMDDFDTVELEKLSLRNLTVLRDQWQVYQTQLEGWEKNLSADIQLLETVKEEIQKEKEIWKITREFSLENDFTQVLKNRIGMILDKIDQTENELAKRLDEMFIIQNRISGQTIEVTKIMEQLEAARESARKDLLAADSLPLWQEISIPKGKPILDQLRSSLMIEQATLTDFFKKNESRLYFHLMLSLILILLLFYFAKKAKSSLPDDRSSQALRHILSRPLSVSILISLLISELFYPSLPLFILEFFELLIFIPLLRILVGLVTTRIRLMLFGLSALFVLHQLYDLISEPSLVSRLILLTITLGAIVGLVGLTNQWRPAPNQNSLWSRAIIIGTRIGIVLFAFSLILNVIGNVSLAELLTRGTLNSIYIAVILWAGFLVLEAILLLFLKTPFVSSLKTLQLHREVILRRTISFFHLVVSFFWALITLKFFALLEPAKTGLSALFGSHLRIGTVNLSLGDVFAFVITIVLSIFLARSIRAFLDHDILPLISLPRGVPGTISFLAHYTILIFGFLLALSIAGLEWSRFALLAGALGVGIGFGLQNIVNNFISGLILIFERPIKVDDMVEIDSLLGKILRIGIRSSTLRTWEGAEVIIPNGDLISGRVINWTLSDRKRRIKIPVGVAYGTDPNTVMEILTNAAKDHPDVLDEPEPKALFHAFGESSLDFELLFSIAEFEDWIKIKSDLTLAVHNALQAANIEIPFPQHDIHLRSIDPSVKNTEKENEAKNGANQGG